MSLLRQIKRNIAKNRANATKKTLYARPRHEPMKLEELEPRLLLSGVVDDTMATKILADLSQYSLPAFGNLSVADMVKAEASNQKVKVDAFLDGIESVASNKLTFDFSKVTNPAVRTIGIKYLGRCQILHYC